MANKQIVLVSGKNGQLGYELQQLAGAFQDTYEFVFADRTGLDVSDAASIEQAFRQYQPAFFINCAAYTAVDKAEAEQAAALAANAEGVGVIARLCNEYKTWLIHVSTDYVFNGNGTSPYKPEDATDPVNYYGYTKWQGEQLALKNNERTVIIRTSWVYSSHGNNFVKTMLRLMKDRTDLNVVSDQVGSPTYAYDLAEAILQVLHQPVAGIYHYSNEGVISWFQFAEAIRAIAALNCTVHPIPTSGYPTPARRPAYSVMDKQKIADTFHVPIKPWQERLEACMQLL
ncbi:dTDP-4-dehydrorhamnose reductase [Deminuibacter soli]|uniref:dTDP-4-dehydrorhamnose reductase n=1 Tax=Deminuibacter soli TaxID=2291815 RepID=A0A3E1NLF1_9BACT|nr:dTDP-4-dehydrorhamnose reductase [Deminuibacter soli]RFM28674.1 dTDP-4-dehydrorhamnose reductase [Deminuibacter soli]